MNSGFMASLRVVLWHDREKRGPPRVTLAPLGPRLVASRTAQSPPPVASANSATLLAIPGRKAHHEYTRGGDEIDPEDVVQTWPRQQLVEMDTAFQRTAATSFRAWPRKPGKRCRRLASERPPQKGLPMISLSDEQLRAIEDYARPLKMNVI
jgi:hypothetical protein